MSNLSSVLKAVEYVAPNDNVIVSSSLKEINDADKIIFPGQGAAKKCMSSINDKNLVGVIKKFYRKTFPRNMHGYASIDGL